MIEVNVNHLLGQIICDLGFHRCAFIVCLVKCGAHDDGWVFGRRVFLVDDA